MPTQKITTARGQHTTALMSKATYHQNPLFMEISPPDLV
jgi:hypothetical protein